MKTENIQESLDKPKQFEIRNLLTHILGGENKSGAKPVLCQRAAVLKQKAAL